MLTIKIDFKHNRTCYFEGEVVSENNFEPEALQSFLTYGWVSRRGEHTPVTAEAGTTLNIHNGRIGHTQKGA